MNCFQNAIEYGVERRDDTVETTQSITIDSGHNFPIDMDDAVVKFSTGSSPLLIDPIQLELDLRLQFLYADGTKMAPLSVVPVAPVAGMSSYIDCLEIWSRGILVRKYEGYNYMEYIKALCDYNDFWFRSVGSASSMWPTIGPQQEDGFLADGGGVFRKDLVKESRIYDLYGKLNIPMLDTDRFLPSTTENSWEFVLKFAKSSFVAVKESVEPKNFKIKLWGAKLHMKKMKLTPSALNHISREIKAAGGFYEYPVLDREIFTYSLLEGVSSRTMAETTLKAYPQRVYIFMSESFPLPSPPPSPYTMYSRRVTFFCLDDTDVDKNQTKSPYRFQDRGIEDLHISINGRVWSYKGMKFVDKGLGQGLSEAYYGSFVRALGKTDFSFNLHSWADNCPFFVFDCTTTENSSSCDSFVALPREPAVMMIHVKFSKALETSVVLRCLVEYRCAVKIAESGMIEFDY